MRSPITFGCLRALSEAADVSLHSFAPGEFRLARKDPRPVPSEVDVVSVLGGQTCVERLAQLFPTASPVRIPVHVTALVAGRRRLREQTVIEFGTAQEVLFSSNL